MAAAVVVAARLTVFLILVQELLVKGFLVELALLLETTVAVVVVVLGESAVHVTQKLQDTVAQAHLTLYQDHYNIMQAAEAQV
jgi:hypothetical protein